MDTYSDTLEKIYNLRGGVIDLRPGSNETRARVVRLSAG